jgi:glutathione S-transferase
MKLYVTYGSPYARLARIVVIEKKLEDHVDVIEAKTRTPGGPYYQINPSGRVPYLVDDAGVGMEDSQIICAYLDSPSRDSTRHCTHLIGRIFGFEFAARSMCDGIAVWGREIARPENERSQTTLAHEAARARRMADFFEDRATDPLMQGPLCMAHLILAVGIEMARKRGLSDLKLDQPNLWPSFDAEDCPAVNPNHKTSKPLRPATLHSRTPRLDRLLWANGKLRSGVAQGRSPWMI